MTYTEHDIECCKFLRTLDLPDEEIFTAIRRVVDYANKVAAAGTDGDSFGVDSWGLSSAFIWTNEDEENGQEYCGVDCATTPAAANTR